MEYCKQCGNKLETESKFCGKCGTKAVGSMPETILASKAPEAPKMNLKKGADMKCGNCDYIGPGEPARSMIHKILAWICVLFAPIITLLYFSATYKYRCPKCKSKFLGVKNKDGIFGPQNGGSSRAVMMLLYAIIGIASVGIVASVMLALLSSDSKDTGGLIGTTQRTFLGSNLTRASEITCTYPTIMYTMMSGGEISHNLPKDESQPMIFTFTELGKEFGSLASIDSTKTITTTPVARIVSNDEKLIYLSFNDNYFSTYTIFKKTGVSVYSKSVDLMGTPSGSMAMGSCVGY